ncbi:hypothetical protein BDF20DRAFT_912094 [Mycotypha africana]|uniref:uncharacterized protein n=1 Tax=Mycotypha africana TaxID=64632 RepID=UPI0023017888|nr:uncharacterized protein BDF20DRAFT_912094 [Mycotypha africana]KAI8981861.1 hypothetical protein BDF20DRAFT_912094 [Mycotypha africana]
MGCCSSTLSHNEEDERRRRRNDMNNSGFVHQQQLDIVHSAHSGRLGSVEPPEQEQEIVKGPDVITTRASTSSKQSLDKSNAMSTATTSNEKEGTAPETSTVTQNHEIVHFNMNSNLSRQASEEKPLTLSQTQQQQQQQSPSMIPALTITNTTTNTTMNYNNNNTPMDNTPLTAMTTTMANTSPDHHDAFSCAIFVRLSSNGQDIKINVPTQPPYLTIAGIRKELSPHLDKLNSASSPQKSRGASTISKFIYLGRLLSDQYMIIPMGNNSTTGKMTSNNNEDVMIPSLPPASPPPPSSVTKNILHHHPFHHHNQQQQKVYIQKQGVIQAMVTTKSKA